MKRLFPIVMLAVTLLLVGCVSQQVSVTFYHTTDIHEHSVTLPRIAAFVESRRKEDPNVLFVDTGDWFNNGDLTPLNTRGEAIVAMLSACKYDALIFGNHDQSFGTQRLAELIDRFSLPVVAANCIWPEDIKPHYAASYRIFELNGVTVAIIGTATSILPRPSKLSDQRVDSLLEILPIEESVGYVVAELEGSADIIVLLTHVGTGTDIKLARGLRGVDIIFGGHDHASYDELIIPKDTDTVVQHTGHSGQYIGELTVTWDGKKIVDRKLRLVEVTDELLESTAVAEIREKYLSQARTPVPVTSQ